MASEKNLVEDISWHQRTFRSKAACIVGGVWTIYTLAYLCNVFFYFDIVVYPVTHRAISSGLICVLVFLILPFRKGKELKSLKWHDLLPVASIIVGCIYIAVNANDLIAEGRLTATSLEMVMGVLLFISIIEATRRTTGMILVGLIAFFFFYTVYSDYFPGFLNSTGFPYSMTIGWMYLSAEGVWGMVLGVVTTVVAGFIIFGGFLRTIGAAAFFNDLALASAGGFRGGAAKASIVASAFFATISGSTAANVATTGQITIPLMKNSGYGPNYSGAVESSASVAGMFTPPVMGATAFLIAEFLQMDYWSVCIAAMLPAVAFYITLFVQVDMQAVKIGLKGLPKEEIPSLRKTLVEGWHYLIPFVLLLFQLGILRYSAQTAIMYALGVLILVTSFNKHTRLTPKRLLLALEDSAKGMLHIIPLCTAIGILIGSIQMTGAGTKFTSELLVMSGDNLFLLLILAGFASFILGMGMTAVGVYILTVVLIAPALVQAGIEPLAAHMFLFYFGCLSFITPPVCVAAYIAAGIADGSPFKTGFRAMKLGIAGYLVPWAFIFNPGILFVGNFIQILTAFLFVTLSTVTLGLAFEGYILQPMGKSERVLVGFSGACLMIPNLLIRMTGIIIIAVIAGGQFYRTQVKKNTITTI
ncbi:TRAP transporter fused permease subunit [Desulfobacula sp.]|uniref:TRAP transporter permease n=1 Tax=Desulfobacula sp. TaxID=2593537 RepID=UPI002639F85C|nr:TRAP transporter fused permease subunit [Desulfobacula sp.]